MAASLLNRSAEAPASPATPGDVVLEVRRLTKRFGSTIAVDSLDMTIRRGQVLGFLGPNGSGKSTTVSMILGLAAPTDGSVHILGQSLADNPALVSRHVGAIIENPAFYPFLSGRDNLRAQTKMVGDVPDARIDELLDLVNMQGRADGKFKTFSLGMKQRIGIASTLLTNPALVILDEPTNGLDPAGQREIRAIIPRLAAEGHSVLLASHMLHEVEQVSDQVIIIHRGKKLMEGSVNDLLHAEGRFEIRLDQHDIAAAANVLREVEGVESITVKEYGIAVIACDECGPVISRSLADAGLYASQLTRSRSSLEDVFLELTSEPLDAAEA